MAESSKPSFEEVTSCQKALFEWAESYDTKDWARLRLCVAPKLRIDYRSFLNKLWEAMPADELIMMASNEKFLGNPLLKTQHLIGHSVFDKTSATTITGTHQLRVAHQRYKDHSLTEVAVKGHAHGIGTMWYEKIDGSWKFAGVCPDIRWTEHDYHLVFADGKEEWQEGEPSI